MCDQLPPNNIEVEEAVLGGILLDPTAIKIEVRREIERLGISVTIQPIVPAVEQAKQHMLGFLQNVANNEHRKIISPCYERDLVDYLKALASPEVRQVVEQRGLKADIHTVDRTQPDIVIATYKDARNGRLDEYFGKEDRLTK